ncbi:MAG: S-layer homology domain-containing protein [Agathobaculum sp.]
MIFRFLSIIKAEYHARGFLQTGGQAVSKGAAECLRGSGSGLSDCENESVCLAAALGIVTGYDDGTFRPYQSITRQKAALIPYHTPTASRCAPFDALAPYPPFACKSAQKSRPETGRLAFWRNYLSCTRSRIESVTESCTLCAE